jgi:signal transduction histidine kinase
MAKTFIIVILFALTSTVDFAQNKQIDSLTHLLSITKDDTSRVLMMSELSFAYNQLNSDSAIAIARRAVALSQQINFPKGEVRALTNLGNAFDTKGDLPEALELHFQGLAIAEENKLLLEKSICLNNIGNIFWDLNNFPKAISSYQQAVLLNKEIKNQPEAASWSIQTEISLGAVFMLNNQLDSAFVHLQKLYNQTLNDNDWYPVILMFFGDLQFRMGKQNEGLNDLRQSIDLFQKANNHYSLGDACRFISECFREINMTDSSIFYAKKGLAEAQSIGYSSPILYNSRTLAELYESKDISKALYYRKVYDSANDIYFGPDKVKGLQTALSDEQERQKKMEAAAIEYKNRLKQYGLFAGLGIILLIAFILYRNNQHKKKANTLLQHQKEKIEDTLAELKSTQSQLIQSEKMASLGELTAGIAHEIQNPLNFVNNFSEVNRELIEELKLEAKSGNINEVIAIANAIGANEQKINHHGKRADAIVKGMLQHTRSSTGVKEPTDINVLADEYLRLSYHGLRAKDNSFNAIMKTDFDNTIGKINIVPQDIGRVLLNLYNNAFYAISEKRKQIGEGYEPSVSVQTKKINHKVVLTVIDNGNGIPQKILDKIFQPFFTTKPTGQGTGLGLSLSYDIIKAHGGEIKVNTKEGEGSEFIIQLLI